MSQKNAPRDSTHAPDHHPQSGVALVVVLVTLMILAMATAAMVQGQRWSVRSSADRLNQLQLAHQLQRTHEACEQGIRQTLRTDSPNTVLRGASGATEFVHDAHAAWQDTPNGEGACLYEWYDLPASAQTPWTPAFRVNARSTVAGQTGHWVSEWRYPSCTVGALCARPTNLRVIDVGRASPVAYSIEFKSTGQVLASERVLP